MTVHKPLQPSIVEWATKDLNIKTIVVVCAIVIGSHYALYNRVTIVEQATPAINSRLDATTKMIEDQRDDIKAKVDRDTYDSDQRKLQDQLTAISDSQGRIESELMARHGR